MTGSELRAEQNIASDSSSCAYSDGPKYVGCQVAARGWPEPQNIVALRNVVNVEKNVAVINNQDQELEVKLDPDLDQEVEVDLLDKQLFLSVF